MLGRELLVIRFDKPEPTLITLEVEKIVGGHIICLAGAPMGTPLKRDKRVTLLQTLMERLLGGYWIGNNHT